MKPRTNFNITRLKEAGRAASKETRRTTTQHGHLPWLGTIFFFTLLAWNPTQSSAKTLSIKDYIALRMDQNSSVASAKARLNSASITAKISSSPNDTFLTVSPYLKASAAEVPARTGTDSATKSAYNDLGISTQYGASLTNGVSFSTSISANSRLNNKTSGLAQAKQSNTGTFKGEINIPFKKNSRGSLLKIDRQIAKESILVATYALEEAKNAACVSAASEFVQSYMDQEELLLLKKQEKNAQDLYLRAIEDRKKKLIKNSDLLSTKIAYLNSQFRNANAQASLDSGLIIMGMNEPAVSLTSPENLLIPLIRRLWTSSQLTELTELTEIKQLKTSDRVAKLKLEKTLEQQKNDVSLFSSYSHTLAAAGAFTARGTSNTLTVGVNIELPITGNQRSQAVQIAANTMYQSQLVLEKETKEISKKISSLLMQIKRLDKIDKINDELNVSVQDQLNSAMSNYKLQKISFENFRLSRDNLLRIQLGFVTFRRRKMNKIIQLLRGISAIPELCGATH